MNEADTCRELVTPRLVAAGWDSEAHSLMEKRGKDRMDFFDQYGPEAREILEELLDNYSDHGNLSEIIQRFGGVHKLREAVIRLQGELYAA